jgi:hypothetical protein
MEFSNGSKHIVTCHPALVTMCLHSQLLFSAVPRILPNLITPSHNDLVGIHRFSRHTYLDVRIHTPPPPPPPQAGRRRRVNHEEAVVALKHWCCTKESIIPQTWQTQPLSEDLSDVAQRWSTHLAHTEGQRLVRRCHCPSQPHVRVSVCMFAANPSRRQRGIAWGVIRARPQPGRNIWTWFVHQRVSSRIEM